MDYKGYVELVLDEQQLADFYSNKKGYEFAENQYLLIKNEKDEVIDEYCYQNGMLRPVRYNTIKSEYSGIIKPRNIQQKLVMDMLQDERSKVKIVRGVYGSGKDYLMLHQALSLLERGKFNKIVFIRPNVTVANVPEIGFLKGEVEDKLGWTLAPLYDKVGGEDGVNALIDKGQLEMVPLLFIRGRSFDNSIVYVTEGQNITSEIAKLIISRIGDNSELWLNADNHQTDRKIYNDDNGIKKMIDKLSGNPLFAYVYMPTTERGEVANLANLLDD